MRKVIITLCYNRPEVVAQSIGRLHASQDTGSYEKYLVDCSYPLPDKAKNTNKLANLARIHGYEFLKPAVNRGVARNWVWTVAELGLKDGDIIIGMDPDSEPMNKNWCDAIVDVLMGDENIAYCGLTRHSPPQLSTEVDESNIKYITKEINGRVVRLYEKPIAWPMGGFSVKFIKEKGIHQPRNYYVFIEIGTMKLMQDTDWYWVMLDEYYDNTRDRGEELYQKWKVAQASGQTKKSFEEYLKDEN